MSLKVKSSEVFLFMTVVTLSILANLPEDMMGGIIDKRLMLIVLAAVVVIALFRYLRLLLFLCVVTLAVGANLPQQLSESLGISQMTMLAFLGAILVVSMFSKLGKKLYGEKLEVSADAVKEDNEMSRRALLIAISKGNVPRLKWLIGHGMEINFIEDGVAPVLLAAETGNSEIMQLLIYHGVDLDVTNSEGKNALQIAKEKGYNRTAENIRFAMENLRGAPLFKYEK